MIRFLLSFLLFLSLALPASAVEFTAPQVPASGREWMPKNVESFGDGMSELLQTVVSHIRPDLKEASHVMQAVVAVIVFVSILRLFHDNVRKTVDITGTVLVSVILLSSANSMIHLGAETVLELSEYGKLLFPVMTASMAAQGGLTSSTALYVGTAVLDSLLGSMISKIMVPFVYLYLALAVSNCAIQDDLLKRLRDMVRSFVGWSLKILLTIYTTYMSITGVVSGTTDAAVLKATKVTISSAVPVIGGILSDASESILVSAGLIKNTAGVYGILALLAIFLNPFLKIGIHYFVLKTTSAVCGVFGAKNIVDLIEDFSAAMGLLLAMTGVTCLLLLISTVCFMKGIG